MSADGLSTGHPSCTQAVANTKLKQHATSTPMPISSTSQHVNVCIVVLFTAPYTGYNLQTSIFRKPSCMSNSALQKDTDSQQKQEQSNSLRAGLIQAWPSPNQFWRPLYSDSDSGSNMSFRTLLCRTLTEKAPSRWRNSSLTMLYVSMSPDNTVLCSAPIQNQSRCEYMMSAIQS